METTQIVIIIITSALAALMIILGIQVFYILKELRITVQKINKMLDDMGRVSGTVGDGVTNMSGFINGLKAGISALVSLKKGKDDE